MLSKIVKDHQARQSNLQKEREAKKRAAIASVSAVSSALLDEVNIRVAEVFATQRKIELEARNVQSQAARFARQTQQWLTLVDGFNEALKEIGDFENWAETIEADMQSIASALERIPSRAPDSPPS
eukprot:EC122259.1.p1 GENE.EC122259.1~~EC122259.1.p1  ORF type:complete len:126 (+),score=17.84 EC122259.1:91-468(+)